MKVTLEPNAEAMTFACRKGVSSVIGDVIKTVLVLVPSGPVVVVAERIRPSAPARFLMVQLTVAFGTGAPRASLTATTKGSNEKERVGQCEQITCPLPETIEILCAEAK